MSNHSNHHDHDDQPENITSHQAKLTVIFDPLTIEQARLIDIADMNLSDDIVEEIANGVNQLKKLKGNTMAQKDLIKNMPPGSRILLCMWIMDMELVNKIL